MTADMTDTTRLHAARLHAINSWAMFDTQKHFGSDAEPSWQEETGPDGTVLLSGQVIGRRAVWALDRFARDFHLHLSHLGDVRPQFDVSQPGRVVLVWRYGGVWVELWHPETAVDAPKVDEPARVAPVPSVAVQATPKPAPAPAARTERRSFLGPGGRLFFTRKSRTTTDKETTTR